MQRTGNRFGIGHLADILVGSRTKRVKQLHHDQLPTYGVGNDKDKRYWRFLMNALIYKGAAGMKPNCEYPVPQVTEIGWQIMRGQETFEIIRFPSIKKVSRKTQKTEEVPYNAPQNDHDLFELLRKRRREIALDRNVPPYAVFNDATLLEMAFHKPMTPEEMLKLTGVGEKKMENYGQDFLDLIGEYVVSSADLEPDFDPEWFETGGEF